jgi:hypothetical protein
VILTSSTHKVRREGQDRPDSFYNCPQKKS